MLSIFKEMAENTSIHGVAQAVTSKYLYKRVIWIILVLGLTGWLFFQLVNLFKGYSEHPIQTTVKLHFSPLPFPAVSFCNMNPVRKKFVNAILWTNMTHPVSVVFFHTNAQKFITHPVLYST